MITNPENWSEETTQEFLTMLFEKFFDEKEPYSEDTEFPDPHVSWEPWHLISASANEAGDKLIVVVERLPYRAVMTATKYYEIWDKQLSIANMEGPAKFQIEN